MHLYLLNEIEQHQEMTDSQLSIQMERVITHVKNLKNRLRIGHGTLEAVTEVLEYLDEAELPYMVREKLQSHFELSELPASHWNAAYMGYSTSHRPLEKYKSLSITRLKMFCDVCDIPYEFLLFSEYDDFFKWARKNVVTTLAKTEKITHRRFFGKKITHWARVGGISAPSAKTHCLKAETLEELLELMEATRKRQLPTSATPPSNERFDVLGKSENRIEYGFTLEREHTVALYTVRCKKCGELKELTHKQIKYNKTCGCASHGTKYYFGGKTLREVAEETGISYNTLFGRLQRGMTIEEATTKKIKIGGFKK